MSTTEVAVGAGSGVSAGVYVKAESLGIFNVLADVTIMASFDTVFYALLGGFIALIVSFYGKMLLNWVHRKKGKR
jgi:hypothetical protein